MNASHAARFARRSSAVRPPRSSILGSSLLHEYHAYALSGLQKRDGGCVAFKGTRLDAGVQELTTAAWPGRPVSVAPVPKPSTSPEGQ